LHFACREGVEFSSFIRGEGYDIIPIKHEHQLAYACNVLNLGKGRIISVHAPSAREIVKHEAFKGDVQVGLAHNDVCDLIVHGFDLVIWLQCAYTPSARVVAKPEAVRGDVRVGLL
jgi:hypothetical protein